MFFKLSFGALVAVFAGLLACTPWAAPAETATLPHVLQRVLAENPTILGAADTLNAQEAAVRARWGAFLPQVTGAGSWGVETLDATPSQHRHPFSQQVIISQQLTLGEETARLRASKADAKAAAATAAQTIQQVLLATAQAYVEVLQAQTTVSQTAQLVTNLEAQKKVADVQFKTGEATQTNVQQAEARLLGAKAELAQAQGSLVAAQESLKALAGPLSPTAVLAWPALPKNLPAALPPEAGVIATHPQFVAAAARAESLENQALAAGTAGLPEVSANASAGRFAENDTMTRYSQPVSARALTLNVTVPLFRGGQVVAAYQGAKAAARAAGYGVQDVHQSLSANLAASWAGWQAAQSAYTAAAQGATAQEAATKGLRAEVKGGERSFLAGLTAEQDVKQAHVTLAKAQAMRLVAAYRLLAALGQLTAENIR